MASFEQCLKYSLDNCPLFKENKITLKEKPIETLRALYEDHDCVSVLPTGYGKRVIFQLLPWFCQLKMEKRKPMSVIVVSPLNSLIQDQVITMRKKGFTACSLNFTGTHGSTYADADCENDEEQDHEYVEIDVPFEQLERGDFCIIYCHPESTS
ncbi:uncharacterized protein LOC117316460 isoform X2 [Pecten maximus]|uniref:uncharacterized protein LOC117316460 isoform X2 n=1 Tax=Pecten maximus TaxID=6579 RepID=UPI0014587D9B|nr:uncharacterized protein LOC117316460 isoform X2 [Pecten maximus]